VAYNGIEQILPARTFSAAAHAPVRLLLEINTRADADLAPSP
jgi:hypothetical protein